MLDKDKKIQFAERLNHALDLRSYPALGDGRISYVQEVFGLSRPGANKWIHGEAIPHRRARKLIAERLGISIKWLETGEGNPLELDQEVFSAYGNVREMPVLSPKEIYNKEFTPKDISQYEKVALGNNFSPKCFVMAYRGEAMSPRYHSGCILIVDPEAEIKDGDFVVARTKNIPEAIFRQYVAGYDTNYLVAINSKFEPMEVHMPDILGKVIEFRYRN